ncbi:hypothetical protein O181_014782 [Austropuccinia psidii MF-1]|uniref:Uncharacterized protein n=1 Tax=Austropuccinia psidii MF-1 TaxID=1389203 RepID=A0A9Q3C2B0_9BASI|nr:hypothetical protein [Austropuccinia psidii MF-1]
MEYKDHEGYTNDQVTLLPEVNLAYNTSVHSVTGKTPGIIEKGWNPPLPVDYLKKILLSIHHTAKGFQTMWKTEFENVEKYIAEAKLWNKQRYDKSHQDPDFKEVDQVLISKLNFKLLKGADKMRGSFVRSFTIIRLLRKNLVEVRLAERFSRKHPVFPKSLVKPYHQTDDGKRCNMIILSPMKNSLKKMIHLDQ